MATVVLRGKFPAGSQVGLYPRHPGALQFVPGNAKALKQTKTDEGSETKFDGLEDGTYFAAAEVDGHWRAVFVTAKPARRGAAKGAPRPTTFDPTLVSQTHDVDQADKGKPVTPFHDPKVGKPVPEDQRDAQIPERHLPQEDFTDVPQRSNTITGHATPVVDENAEKPDAALKKVEEAATPDKPKSTKATSARKGKK